MDVALDKDTLNQPEDTSLSQEFQVPQFVLVLAGYSEHVSYVTSKDGERSSGTWKSLQVADAVMAMSAYVRGTK